MRISAIVNCRYEGLLLERSLNSALRAIESSGFVSACELIVVADCPTRTTMGVVTRYRDRIDRVIETDLSDLGLARNAGVQVSRGQLVLFLDGDDLWGRNWVQAAWSAHLSEPEGTILHPQYCVFFGGRSEVLVHPDWRDANFDPRALAVRNCWTALCGARRDVLIECPYAPIDVERRAGYEDWSWYAETVGRGLRHAVVRDTAHFIRVKQTNSLQGASRGFLRVASTAFAEYLAEDDSSRPHNL